MTIKVIIIMRLGAKIKKLRELKDYTQDYMANRLKMGVSSYGNIERGTVKDLTVERLLQIAQVLEIEFSEIINYDLRKPYRISSMEPEDGRTEDEDEFYASCIMAVVEQSIRDKKAMINLLNGMRETNTRLAHSMAEHTKQLALIAEQQQELLLLIRDKK